MSKDKPTLDDLAEIMKPMANRLSLDFFNEQAAWEEMMKFFGANLTPSPWYKRLPRRAQRKIANAIVKLGVKLGGDYEL